MTFKDSSTAAWATRVDFHLVVARTPRVKCAVLMMLCMTAMWASKNSVQNTLLVWDGLASAAPILQATTTIAVMSFLTER